MITLKFFKTVKSLIEPVEQDLVLLPARVMLEEIQEIADFQ
jgi:hypothetical protein